MRHVTLLPEWPRLNQEIQEWLGKYGTARVKLNVDKDFWLKDSSLEMLYPILWILANKYVYYGCGSNTWYRRSYSVKYWFWLATHSSGNDWMAG
ncbi:inverse autotransporter beta domain-containing protein [Escherichia coli]